MKHYNNLLRTIVVYSFKIKKDMKLIRNCENCFNFQHFKPTENGLEYVEEMRCANGNDINNNTSELNNNFNRKIERECNILDFWKVLAEDEELLKMFKTNFDDEKNCAKTFSYFKEKYEN